MTFVRKHPEHIEDSVWGNLASVMVKEAKIMTERNTPRALADLYAKGLAVALEQDGVVIGYIAAWPIGKGFLEVGSAWIHSDYRGNGHASTLYTTLHTLLLKRTEHVFAITQNPIALKAGRHARLELNGCWTDPIPWEHTCAPCEWVEDSKKLTCGHRNNICMLRIMQR